MKMCNPPHPGEILKEMYIKPLDLTITEVAKGLNITRKTLSELVNQKTGISPKMAVLLSKAFKTTPESWMNLQDQYDLWTIRKKIKLSKIKVFIHPSTRMEKLNDKYSIL